MFRKSCVFGIVVVVSALTLGVTATSFHLFHVAHAATINCAGVSGVCLGTTGDDTMVGDGGPNFICARSGNDRISLSGGNDKAAGNDGNDFISGGYGEDTIAGGSISSGSIGCISGRGGADNLNGGPDNDKIFHSSDDVLTDSDGAKDVIDCGPGNDEAWINTSHDGDVAINCETVHAG
jgi:Ca2+-binding RTX toxin-like protein